MATIRKRLDKWQVLVKANGLRKSKTFESKATAKMWAAQTEAELMSLSAGVSQTHTFGCALERYLKEVTPTKRSPKPEENRINRMLQESLASIKLIDMKRQDLEKFIDKRLKLVKGSSVNRDLNLVSHVLTQARRWNLMDHNPMKDLQRPLDPPARDRRISQNEIDMVLTVLNYSEDVPVETAKQRIAVMFLLAIETGMRLGELCSLRADTVNLVSRVATLEKTKNGTMRKVPLSARAVELLQRVEPSDNSWFKTTSDNASALFRKYVAMTPIQNLTFHDTRHEAITRLATKLDVLDLARMIGHKNINELMTYYNASAEELATKL